MKEGFASCEQYVQDVVMEATRRFVEAGAVVEQVSVPMHNTGI